VTRELCEKHPDVFSLGLPGASLLPHCDREAYSDKVRRANADYKCMMMEHDPRSGSFRTNPDEFAKKIFDSFKSKAMQLRTNHDEIVKKISDSFIVSTQRRWSEEEIIRYYNLKLAMLFYEASMKLK
jgi:hypothetical protein